jgi:hypothetical protein
MIEKYIRVRRRFHILSLVLREVDPLICGVWDESCMTGCFGWGSGKDIVFMRDIVLNEEKGLHSRWFGSTGDIALSDTVEETEGFDGFLLRGVYLYLGKYLILIDQKVSTSRVCSEGLW